MGFSNFDSVSPTFDAIVCLYLYGNKCPLPVCSLKTEAGYLKNYLRQRNVLYYKWRMKAWKGLATYPGRVSRYEILSSKGK
jgi:hypothetical protein